MTDGAHTDEQQRLVEKVAVDLVDDARCTVIVKDLGSMLPILNVGSEVAYGAVIASLAAFAVIKTWLMSLTDNPVIGLAIIVMVYKTRRTTSVDDANLLKL